MKIFILGAIFALAGCATPPALLQQRSELVLIDLKGLILSTSKTFENIEFEKTADHIYLHQYFILQNSTSEQIEINLGNATFNGATNNLPLECKSIETHSDTQSNESAPKTISLAPSQKAQIHCSRTINIAERWKSDEMVVFKIPASGGREITAKKLVRSGDFQ